MTDTSARPPFRADHVGSLLRPQEVLRAREDFAAGAISAQQLREIEDAAIQKIIGMQGEVGLKSATDGELRRESWHMDFIYSLGGITKVQDDTIKVAFHNKDKNYEWAPPSAHVTAPVTLKQTIFADAFSFVKDNAAPAQTPKLTIPSPSMVHYRGGREAIDQAVYPDLEQFWDDLAKAYAEEIQRLYDLGCRYLQLDDTSMAYVNDPRQREHIAAIGGDPHQHETYIATMNKALGSRPADMAITVHTCRGNNQSMWAAEGSYDFVADSLFNGLNVDGFFCEWDDERSGGFEPLRYLPKGKRVVLGVMTTKSGELESKDYLKRRVEEAAKYADIDQLCISGQCGFSSTKEGNSLTQEQQWAKLSLIVETAAEIWPES